MPLWEVFYCDTIMYMQRFTLIALSFVIVFGFIFSDVGDAFAQGLVPVGTENYSPQGYGTCELVELVNNVIAFLFTIASLIAVIVFVYAGFLLVSSRGNVAQIEKAKGLFSNAIIGFIIMLSAFLIVNTIMSMLLGSDSPVLNWKKIECSYANEPGEATFGIDLSSNEYEVSVGDGSTVTVTTGTGKDVQATACDDSQMVTTNFLGGSVRIHENFIQSVKRIDQRWRAKGGQSFYKVTSIGGYVCRKIRGSGKMSNHSYGLAIDINPMQNPHLKSACRTDMPPEFRQLFLDEGWGWGCNWRSSKDAMHFSKARNEGGNMTGG